MPRKITPTVAEAIDQYMRTRSHLATTSAMNDRSVLRRFAAWVGPDRHIGYLNASNVESYFIEVGQSQKPASFNKVRQRVSLFLRYCARHGWVKADLMVDVRARRVPQVERLRLSPQQLVEFVDVPSDPRDRAFLMLAMNTALRSSEITSLRVRDINLDLGEIYVFRPKTQQDDRLLIVPSLDRELRKWLSTYASLVQDGHLGRDFYLFPARHAPKLTRSTPGQRQESTLGELRPTNQMTHPHRIVQRALERFGIDVTRQEGLHTIRRSVARAFFDEMCDRGYDTALRATASLLGHKNTATTEIYLGLSSDRRRRDGFMRGRDFLPFDVAEADVIPLRRAE